jgi:hypothetical protein
VVPQHPRLARTYSLHAWRWSRLLLHRHHLGGSVGSAAHCRCVGASHDGWVALVASDYTTSQGSRTGFPPQLKHLPLYTTRPSPKAARLSPLSMRPKSHRLQRTRRLTLAEEGSERRRPTCGRWSSPLSRSVQISVAA